MSRFSTQGFEKADDVLFVHSALDLRVVIPAKSDRKHSAISVELPFGDVHRFKADLVAYVTEEFVRFDCLPPHRRRSNYDDTAAGGFENPKHLTKSQPHIREILCQHPTFLAVNCLELLDNSANRGRKIESVRHPRFL
jgi:hypothetical protein